MLLQVRVIHTRTDGNGASWVHLKIFNLARNIRDVQERCIYFFRQYDVGNTRDTIIHRGHDSLTCLNIWVRRLLKTNLEQISGE